MTIEMTCTRRAALGGLCGAGLLGLTPALAETPAKAPATPWAVRTRRGGRSGQPDRYRLEIPAGTLNTPTVGIRLDMATFAAGKGKVESGGVRVTARAPGAAKAREIRRETTAWDQATGALNIGLAEAIPPTHAIAITLDVRNPEAGTVYIKSETRASNDGGAWLGLAVWTLEIAP